MDELTDQDRTVLAFARLRWNYQGHRDAAIREQFGMSTTVYLAHLVRLLDSPAAEAHDPELVHRLRRLRADRFRRCAPRAA